MSGGFGGRVEVGQPRPAKGSFVKEFFSFTDTLYSPVLPHCIELLTLDYFSGV